MIQNKEEIGISAKRKDAIEIIESGIESIMPENLFNGLIFEGKTLILESQQFEINGRIFVIGAGKASSKMAEVIEKKVKVHDGIVISVSDANTSKIKIIKGSHPIPDESCIDGTKQILALKEKYNLSSDDVVINLISGGGSSLLSYPVENITLDDLRKLTELLLHTSADINEINIIRKHISKVKGGRLGKHFYPSRVISLIISDVVGKKIDVISSGPTYPDNSTFIDAMEILNKYNLVRKIPRAILNHIQKGLSGLIQDTPKTLDNCTNFIVADNVKALRAMQFKAVQMGYHPLILTSEMKGNTQDMAKFYLNEIITKYDDYDVILLGGETTLEVIGDQGVGGRNQHFIATSLLELDREMVIVSIGTDGQDYITDVAGGIIDNESVKGLSNMDSSEYLDRFDSYNLLKKIGNSQIRTGFTNTNVGDIVLYLK